MVIFKTKPTGEERPQHQKRSWRDTAKLYFKRALLVAIMAEVVVNYFMWSDFAADMFPEVEAQSIFEQCETQEMKEMCALPFVECNCPKPKVAGVSTEAEVMEEDSIAPSAPLTNTRDLAVPTVGQRAATTRVCRAMSTEYAQKLKQYNVSQKMFEELCNNDMLGMASQESGFSCERRGTSGEYGCFQIILPSHPEVTKSCALDYECALGHTLRWMMDYEYPYPYYRTRAIASHNGGPTGYQKPEAMGYAENVKALSEGYKKMYSR